MTTCAHLWAQSQPGFSMQSPSPRLPQTLGLLVAVALAACGGKLPGPGDLDGGPDAGLIGVPCQFDQDCQPTGKAPNYLCGADGGCQESCLLAGCPSTPQCNTKSGRCDPRDGGVGGGGDGGADGGSDAGTVAASDTLCKTCSVSADCHAGGLCVQNSAHTETFCTQDCTSAGCPSGYLCTVDRTGTKHQCYPSSGDCSPADGGTAGDPDGGPTTDPTTPSDNPDGCGFCGTCKVNNDCASGSVCVNGGCVAPCTSYLDCAFQIALLASCAVPAGFTEKYCLPLLGACLPLPAPLGGDTGCVPSSPNATCAPGADLPASLGANVKVLATDPVVGTEDSIAVDGAGRMAIGYIGIDVSDNSYVGVSWSATGASWTAGDNGGKMAAKTSQQADPVLATSKWTDGAGAHERMHYAWYGYTRDTSNPQQTVLKDMFVEAAWSDNGGKTWTATANDTRVTTTADTQSNAKLVDKPWIAAGPDGTLILTFTLGDDQQQDLFARVSTDHGATWGAQSYAVTNAASDAKSGHNLGMPVFDPRDATGNTVFVAFLRYTQVQASSTNSIQVVKSTDRGHTWSQPVTVSAAGDQVLFDPPSVAIDKAGHLYVGYAAAAGSAGSAGSTFWDAKVATVDVTAATPSATRQTRVNDDFQAAQAAGCFQHFHTMVAVDGATGKVFAAFLDNRRANAAGGVYYSSSTDQGATWAANKRASDSNFTFNPDRATAQKMFLGDYFGFVFDGSRLRFAWSDPRNGTSSQPFYVGGTP